VGGLIMFDALLLAAFAFGDTFTPADTVIELRRGDRVVLESLSGEISIGSWERDQLELRGDDDDVALLVRRSGSTVRIVQDDTKGRRRSVEASIRLPSWVDIEVGGLSLDVWIDGMHGRVEVSNMSGDVWVRDARGAVDVRTIEGEIDVSAAYGGVSASSQADDVRLRDVSGPVSVHSGSGDVDLIDIESADVRAETQDGDIVFSGTIADTGDYGFFVHDGDAIIAIPSSSSARVGVSTFDGDFESEFPVVIERFTGGREFDFQVGTGRARIQIQVFDGEIRLVQRR
jgi:DUF4097 and DUF4098 domain-containing protein YvlB